MMKHILETEHVTKEFRGHPAVIRGGSKFMGGAIMQVEEIRE